MDPLIIGLGHKARQGKDWIAAKAVEGDNLSIILHFADPLKEEVENKERKFPLIYIDDSAYNLLSDSKNITYISKLPEEVPYLHKIIQERNITEYWGMDSKDSKMLQFWGTDFRRASDDNYWVNKIKEQIESFNGKYRKVYIPDVRFKNELAFIREMGGIYIEVIRVNKDTGDRWLDDSRDPNHASEIDLDNAEFDISVLAHDGDLNSLNDFANYLKKI